MRCSPPFFRLLLAGAALGALLVPHTAGWSQEPSGPPAEMPQAPAGASAAAPAMPPAPPQEDPAGEQTAVRLSDVEGSVRLSDSTGKLFDQVLRNMAMLPGMTIETGNTGRAELEFPDGSLARITPNSALALLPLAPGHTYLTLQPTRGLTYYAFAAGGNSFAVVVGPLTARLPAAASTQQAILRVNLDDAPYQAGVLRGAVHFEDASGNATYDLEANQTAKIDPDAATNYDISLDLALDTWDAWNVDRDNARAEIAGSTSPGGQNGGPGWNDLNFYGSWYNVPGQGMAWAPDGVGADFDPYGSGAWGYYSGAGYGWVSSYPWGWLPYHCGLWNYYPGNVWMWLPSNCGGGVGGGYGWYPYSEVRNPPHLYRRPQPPHGGRPLHPAQALIAVNRGPEIRFRAPGQPRPVARTLVVSGLPLQPAPVETRPSYRSAVPAAGASQGMMGGAQGGYYTGSRFVGAAPGVAPATNHIMTAPRAQMAAPPAQHMSAPPAMSAPVSAPHISAPAASSSGHSH